MNGRSTGGTAVLLAGVLVSAAALGSCAATDVVATYAESSFKALAAASAGRTAYDEGSAKWILRSEAGDSVGFSVDFSRGPGDVEFSFDAAPFLDAGLDPSRLSFVEGIAFALENGRLALRFDLGSAGFDGKAKNSMEAAFAEILKHRRDAIGYHAQLDHYGISLGGGNMFEWAKDLAKNDKDIVWVLDPTPFIAAGVDPLKVAGWVFGSVEMMEGSKKFQVEKLLKPFDIR